MAFANLRTEEMGGLPLGCCRELTEIEVAELHALAAGGGAPD